MRSLPVLIAFLPVALAAQEPPVGPPPARPPEAPPPDSVAGEVRERAAARGWVVGVTGYTGGTWQPSGVDLGYLWRAGSAAGQILSFGIRVGSFVQDQAVLVGGSAGFFAAFVATVKRPIVQLATLGTELNPSVVRLEGTGEVDFSLNARSPLPQGSSHAAGALLAGITVGGPGSLDQSFGIFIGPAYFFGKVGTWYTQFSLRVQAPLGR